MSPDYIINPPRQPAIPADWVTSREAAQLLNVTVGRIQDYRESGLLPSQISTLPGQCRPWRHYYRRDDVLKLNGFRYRTRARIETPYPFSPTTTECAYAAGIIDGEGYISLRPAKATVLHSTRFNLQVSVSNRSQPVIAWLCEHFGGVVRDHPRVNPRWADIYVWCLNTHHALHVLRHVQPYLIIKQKQAALAIEFQERVIHAGLWRHEPLTDREIAYRRTLYERMRELNKRGPLSTHE